MTHAQVVEGFELARAEHEQAKERLTAARVALAVAEQQVDVLRPTGGRAFSEALQAAADARRLVKAAEGDVTSTSAIFSSASNAFGASVHKQSFATPKRPPDEQSGNRTGAAAYEATLPRPGVRPVAHDEEGQNAAGYAAHLARVSR